MNPNNKLPPGYKVRAAVKDDVGVVVDLINFNSRVIIGETLTSLDDKKNAWETPGFNISSDTHLVFTKDDILIGLVEFWDILEPHVQATVHLHVHPENDPVLIGSYLLSWADQRAKQIQNISPEGEKIDLLIRVDGQDVNNQQILHANGYIHERTFWRMLLEMESPPAAKELPEGFFIRSHVAGQDDRAMYNTIEAAFADHWRHVPIAYNQWAHWNLEDDEFDPYFWFLAIQAGMIVGGLMSWMTFNNETDTGWISDLGVLKKWRCQGIGEALLSRSFRAFFERGIKKVILLVDTDSNTGALHLYKRVGMKPIGKQFVYEKIVYISD